MPESYMLNICRKKPVRGLTQEPLTFLYGCVRHACALRRFYQPLTTLSQTNCGGVTLSNIPSACTEIYLMTCNL